MMESPKKNFINVALGLFLGEREVRRTHEDTEKTKTKFVILGKISNLNLWSNSYFFGNDYWKGGRYHYEIYFQKQIKTQRDSSLAPIDPKHQVPSRGEKHKKQKTKNLIWSIFVKLCHKSVHFEGHPLAFQLSHLGYRGDICLYLLCFKNKLFLICSLFYCKCQLL